VEEASVSCMSLCYHTTEAEVDLEALDYNYHQLRRLAPPEVKFLAVVKADAYGHGAVPVSKRLEELGTDFLGVATVKEGAELREGGVHKPILVLSGVYQEEVEAVLAYHLTPMLYRLEIAEALSAAAGKQGTKVPVHIKVDTGMGRLNIHPPFCHIANSAGLVNLPSAHFTVVRPGIMLYGSYPSPSLKENISLRQVMSWKSRIADLKKVPEGYSISYGRTFVTQRPSIIAAIPVGYADGYHRLFSNRGEVLIKGKRAPVVGRVCMDWTMVDVTDLPSVEVGEEVVLMGSQLGQEITPEEMGEWMGTISYEILCAVGKRVRRIYKG
jgi:alanine racemase